MKTHKDLDVWKKAISLAKFIYDLTKYLPKEETYGLSDQMKRSTVSIASNVAEGAARQSDKEFIQFLYIALGSASELDTQLEICRAIGFKSVPECTLETIHSSPVFLVPANSPWKTIQQAFEDIKAQPYIQFLIIARGPLCELGTQLLISNDLGYMQVTLNPFLPREGV